MAAVLLSDRPKEMSLVRSFIEPLSRDTSSFVRALRGGHLASKDNRK